MNRGRFFFGFSLVFGFLFILSTFTIGFEIFLGVMALAGGCCVISEVLMIISIHVFEPIQAIPPLAKPSGGDQAAISLSATAVPVTTAEVDAAAAAAALLLQISADARRPAFSSPWRSTPWAVIVRDLHALVVTILVVNLQYLPFLGILPVFLTAALQLVDTLTHWFSACVVSKNVSSSPSFTFFSHLRLFLCLSSLRRLAYIH